MATHDSTGPFTVLAGVHLALDAPKATFQETVRAHIRTWHRDLIPDMIDTAGGRITPPEGPGIGATLLPSLLDGGGTTVVVSDLARTLAPGHGARCP